VSACYWVLISDDALPWITWPDGIRPEGMCVQPAAEVLPAERDVRPGPARWHLVRDRDAGPGLEGCTVALGMTARPDGGWEITRTVMERA